MSIVLSEINTVYIKDFKNKNFSNKKSKNQNPFIKLLKSKKSKMVL